MMTFDREALRRRVIEDLAADPGAFSDALERWRANVEDGPNSSIIGEKCANCWTSEANVSSDGPRMEIWFELESACNWNCKFCYNSWRSGKEPPPAAQPFTSIVAALDELATEAQCSSLVISGGEPLLRLDLIDILRAIRRHQIPTALTTNGSLLTPEKIVGLRDAGVTTFVVSLHSHKESTHNILTGAHSWRSALNGILLLRESGADTAIVFVATRQNMDEFPQVVDLCGLLGIRRVIFNRFVPAGQGFDYKDELGIPSDDELTPILKSASGFAQMHSMKITLGVPIESIKDNRIQDVTCGSCVVRSGQARWTLGPDLQIRRCNSFRGRVASVLDGAFTRLLRDSAQRGACGGETYREFIPCRIIEAHVRGNGTAIR